jgi:hypothetical protein
MKVTSSTVRSTDDFFSIGDGILTIFPSMIINNCRCRQMICNFSLFIVCASKLYNHIISNPVFNNFMDTIIHNEKLFKIIL